MALRGRRFDESHVTSGARDRRSRGPRTKDRPAHRDAVTGRVLTVDRGRYTCLLTDETHPQTVVTAMKARELGRSGVVVGDRVQVVGDLSGDEGTLARVVRVLPRTGTLRRTADDTDPVERIVVTGVEQLVIVTALAHPQPRPRMIDRCLVAAYDAGIEPLLCLTKADLAAPQEFLARYRPLALRTVVTGRGPDGALRGVEEVRDLLVGRDSVLVGHSGVGKSTLVNALVPQAERATGQVNVVTGRGRHTSSSAVAYRLRQDGRPAGWITDTPGVRSFGLAHVDPGRLLHAFEDLAPGERDCPRGCSHDEPECALDAYVASGAAGPSGQARLDSLRRLLRARTGKESVD